MKKAMILNLWAVLLLLVSGCGKKMPSSSEVATQLEGAFNTNSGVPVVAIENLEVRDLHQEGDLSYILVDFDARFLISKTELLAAQKAVPKPQLGFSGRWLELLNPSTPSFEKGDVKKVRGEKCQVIQSEKGWIVDPNQ